MATVDEKTEIIQEEESGLNIKDIFYSCVSNWYWILISVVIFLGLGVFYILKSVPRYTREAQIVIKEDSKRGKAMSQFDEFASMGLFQSNTVLLNEIATLQSPDMMERVVEKLNLQMNYSVPGRFHDSVLYGSNLPVNVKMYSAEPDQSASFKLTLGADSTFTLSDFMSKGQEIEGNEVKGRISQMIQTPVGNIAIYPTEHYNASKNEVIMVSHAPLRASINKYCGELTITQPEERSGVVDIVINDVSIERGDAIINTLIDTYNQNWIEDRNEISMSTRDFIEERLRVIVSELEGVDSDISSYKSNNLVPDVAAVSKMYMDNANMANSQLMDLNNRLGMARYVKAHIASTSTGAPQLIPANSGFETPALASEIGNYNTMVLQRNNLVANSNESNPLVVDMDKSIADMRTSIGTSIDNVIESLQRQIRSMERRENDAISKISSNPEQAKYLLSIERQQKVKESLYLYLLQKREENEISQTFTPYNTKVIMSPQGSNIPSSPRKLRILLACFVLGLALPIGIITLKMSLYNKVRGRKDLENLSIPFAGEIPYHKNSKFLKKHTKEALVVVEHNNRNIINEAFRVVRANLEFMMGNKKVIAITSANPDSGKTFIDYNIALCFALKGKRVLSIDGDLRKASLSEYAQNTRYGLTDYLAGNENDINDLIVQSEQNENLFVLPRGTMPPNPTELLYSEKFGEMLDTLRNDFDLIFIDCPPIEVVADSMIINKHVDMTIFIIRTGLFDRDMLPEIQRQYINNKYNDMVVILNGTNASRSYGNKFDYNYGYSSSYGGYEK